MSDSKDPSRTGQELEDQETLSALVNGPSLSYVEARQKYEDVKSTAWTFTITGILGAAALLFLWSDIFPLSLSVFTKCSFTLVLGLLFLFFLITGIKSFVEMKELSAAAATEEARQKQIEQWFFEHYSADAISNGMDSGDLPIEQLYFLRSENISRLIREEFRSYDDAFLEYMSEKVYQMYFPD